MTNEVPEVRLERLSQPAAESRLKDSHLVVMAPGSIEQHGPHLPLGTDAFAANTLPEEVARKMDAALVPLPLIGVSPYHLSWAGSLSLQPQRMISVIEDISECLRYYDVDKVLFVNWHGGNTPTLRLAGDSAMTYSLGELAALTQQGMNITVVVMNNSAMGWIKWEQAVFWDGKFVSTDLSDVNFAVVAQGMGLAGVNVTEPADLRDALSHALISDQPTLVDVRTAIDEAAVPKFTASDKAKELMRENP